MRLCIFIPSSRDWKPLFGSSLLGMMNNIYRMNLDAVDIAISMCSLLSQSRQMALDGAIKAGFTHLLMIDDDMTFPGDTLERLARHDLGFVGVNYKRKTAHYDGSLAFDSNGKQIDSSSKSGMEEVYFVGHGINLINLDKIKHIHAPHFCVGWDKDKGYMGEDYFFCQKLRSSGVPIYIDHDLSKQIGHIGDYEFKFKESIENIFQLKKAG